MNRKTVLLVAALLAGGSAAYTHREAIMLRFGLESMHPAYYRAIDLAKSARSLDRYHTNHFEIQKRLRLEGGEIDPDGWKAERVSDVLFQVTYRSTVKERSVQYDFQVDVGKREVTVERNDPNGDREESYTTPR